MRFLFAFSLSVMMFGGLLQIWVQQEIVQLGYRLSAEQEKQQQLRTALQQIEVDMASAHAPATLQKLAQQFQLVPARSHQFVKLPRMPHPWSQAEELVDAEP